MATLKRKLAILSGIIFLTIFVGYYFGIYQSNKKAGISEQQQKEQLAKETEKNEMCQPVEGYDSQYQYRFEDYPVKEMVVKPSVPLNLQSDPIGLEYKTAITRGYNEGPNYAGHYTVVTWGCGAECQVTIVVNNATGNILKADMGATRVGVEYRKESRLLVANTAIEWVEGCRDIAPAKLRREYYLPSEDGSKLILASREGVDEDYWYGPICENKAEIETFEKPVPVEWLAQFGGCLAGCDGASFTRLPEDGNFKHPYFAGYFGKDVFKEELSQEGLTLKISGKWIGIDADHPKLVFNNKCVPIVDIEKIEVVKYAK